MLFLDTNAVLYYLHGVEPYSRAVEDLVSEEDELYTSVRVLDEAIFTIVRTGAWTKLGIRRIEKLREYIREHGYGPFKDDVDELYRFLGDLNVVVVGDKAMPQELREAAERFHLLPADAVIALTCRHHGIDTILTFDEDFRRVPWLRVAP